MEFKFDDGELKMPDRQTFGEYLTFQDAMYFVNLGITLSRNGFKSLKEVDPPVLTDIYKKHIEFRVLTNDLTFPIPIPDDTDK